MPMNMTDTQLKKRYRQRIYILPFNKKGDPLRSEINRYRDDSYFCLDYISANDWQKSFVRFNLSDGKTIGNNRRYLTPNHLMLLGFAFLSESNRQQQISIADLANLLVGKGNLSPLLNTFNDMCLNLNADSYLFFSHCLMMGIDVLSNLVCFYLQAKNDNDLFLSGQLLHFLSAFMIETLPEVSDVVQQIKPLPSTVFANLILGNNVAGELILTKP